MVKLKTVEPGKEFELIPEGEVVSAVLDTVKSDQYTWDGETVDKLNWWFTVTDEGEFNGIKVRGSTSTAFTAHPNCKAYNWVAAITGKKYAEGEGLDTDDIVGMPARIIIKHRPGKEGATWMDVRDVLPASASQKAKDVPADQAPF